MPNQRRTPASKIALGGVLAALAVVIMCLGGLLPIATYVSPMLCALLLQSVKNSCGDRIGWAWYAAVAILGLLLSPDKEAAGVFLFLGYYPIVKPKLDGRRLSLLWKGLLFNVSVCLLYFLLMRLFGMEDLNADFAELGKLMLLTLLVLGNVTFFLLDRLLGMEKMKRLGR